MISLRKPSQIQEHPGNWRSHYLCPKFTEYYRNRVVARATEVQAQSTPIKRRCSEKRERSAKGASNTASTAKAYALEKHQNAEGEHTSMCVRQVALRNEHQPATWSGLASKVTSQVALWR